ncbi:MAG TPA: diaminobutyrate--2-oxoglutarate transaminase [Woeseiaceae bacterium]|nr:diaminobutyrate--2-oxoglutarate transaminase [Woeseiaceae bacterium]
MSEQNKDSDPAVETFELLESQVRSYARNFPRIFHRASGSWLYTRDGAKYLDFLMGCSTLNYGHNHPDLKRALIEYISSDGITHSLDMYSESKEKFLGEFHETILEPRKLDYVVQFPGPTGANAVEAALKLARKVTGRQNVIAFTNGFHGVTLGALATTANGFHRNGAGVALSGVTRMPFDGYFGPSVDTATYLDRMLEDGSSGVDAPAAVIVETVQGEGGLNVADYDWLRNIAAIARKHGALFIVDDIQAGAGRTGTFFSFEPAKVKPDIVTLAKSISGYGLPLALVLIDRTFDEWLPGEHNGTFRGNCHAFVTARAALEHFWRDSAFEQSIYDKGQLLKTKLEDVARANGFARTAVKGRGMMRGLEMPSGELAGLVVKKAFADGLVIETSGSDGEIVKCLAALTISDEDLIRGLDIMARSVRVALDRADRAAA